MKIVFASIFEKTILMLLINMSKTNHSVILRESYVTFLPVIPKAQIWETQRTVYVWLQNRACSHRLSKWNILILTGKTEFVCCYMVGRYLRPL